MFPGRFPHLYSTLDFPREVPVQKAAYELVVSRYIQQGDRILDVGFGLGYGIEILVRKAGEVRGIEIDSRAISYARKRLVGIPQLYELLSYNGEVIPYDSNYFDVVSCVDVIEHVPDYLDFLKEMIRVTRRAVFISTPNRRPEYTRPDGKPKNRWHLREWTPKQFEAILQASSGEDWEWNFINGTWGGPFTHSTDPQTDTLALAPAIFVHSLD
jgi:ubiquinone/menaquinone biosynthesis C-methylase UbiE